MSMTQQRSPDATSDPVEHSRGPIAGRYRILSTLGQGGMGAVYRAHDTRLDRAVAIKTILPQHLASPLASQRFFREARALARLNHPNILTLYDYGQEGDLHYLVMELGERDLQQVLESRGGPLPIEQTVRVAKGVCRALDYAHGHRVIHRDLKPGNILLGSANDGAGAAGQTFVVKVMDFGLARVQGASAITAPLARVGTPQYMSPEQALGQVADERSDLYALGVVLYELTTGVRPFDSDDPQTVLSQHLHLAPVPPSVFNPAVPADLEALIRGLLEKDPTRRPATARAVGRALDGIGSESFQRPLPSSTPVGSSPLGRLPARVPLVGRVAELNFLKAQFESVAAGGGGQLLFVLGEPGVGKTRLVRELGSYARLRGGVFVEGHYLREGNVPYGPWVEALRSCLQEVSGEELTKLVGPYGVELSQIFLELTEPAESTSLGSRPPALTPDQQRQRLFDGVAELIRNLTQRAPLVLLLDDLQWAPGLTLLAHVARQLGNSRAFILGTYRNQEFNERPGLVREWAELNRARLMTEIRVQPLSDEETRQLVAHYFGEGPAGQLREPVYHQTRGNVFFVEEVLRSLAESGAVQATATGWEVADLERLSIPPSMKLAVEERVARLGETAREVLMQAAVLGQEFTFRALQALTGRSEDELLDICEAAVAARLVTDRSVPGEERYAFADDQVQEVLYGNISPVRRRRYHVRAAQALEALYADGLEAHLEELTRHFLAGNELEKAADYAFRAALKNERVFNWSHAALFNAQALDALARLPDTEDHRRQRVDLLLRQVNMSLTVDAPARNVARLTEAEALARRLPGPDGAREGDQARLARIHLRFGSVYGIASELPQALDYVRQALAAAEELGDEQLLAMSTWMTGRILVVQGRFAEAEPLLTRALAPLEKHGRGRNWLYAICYRRMAVAARGRYAEALIGAHRPLERAVAAENWRDVASCHLHLWVIHFAGGNLPSMLAESDTTLEAAERSDEQTARHMAHGIKAWTESRLGNHEMAWLHLTQARSIAQSLGSRLVIDDWFAAARAEIALNAGQVADALTFAKEAVTIAQSVGGIFGEGLARRTWGQALAALDSSRWDEAEAHLAASLRCFEEGDARLEAARTHVAWGLLCRDRQDAAAARGHLEQAAAQFEASGLADELERTRCAMRDPAPQVKDQAGRPRKRGYAAYPDRLTVREVEVLCLLAAGRTSKEIADALVVSVSTVERHISNLYAKIGARGRVEATAYALRHRLVPAECP